MRVDAARHQSGVVALLAAASLLVACSSDDPLKHLQSAADPPALPHLSVQQADVSDQYTVTLLPEGTDAQAVPTLDLCAATYPGQTTVEGIVGVFATR